MVATKILGLYASVWEPLMSNDLTGGDLIEFSKKLPKLHQALSCCVCSRLLADREAFLPTGCREHFVCRACLGKPREESKKCKRCDDWGTYVKDETLSSILQSYQDFCFLFLTSDHIVRILEVKHEVDPKFNTFQLIDLIQKGLKGFSKAKKRKLLREDSPAKKKGVVPINVPRKDKKKRQLPISTPAVPTTPAPVKRVPTVPKPSPVPNKDFKKPPTKKPAVSTASTGTSTTSDNLQQKSPVRPKQKLSTVYESRNVKPQPSPSTSNLPAKPLNVTKPSPVKNRICAPVSTASSSSSSVGTSASTFTRQAEPAKSPPVVTIKVEVQTTPEKSLSPHNEDVGPFPMVDPTPTPNPPREPARSPIRLVASRSKSPYPNPSVASISATLNSSTTSTVPSPMTYRMAGPPTMAAVNSSQPQPAMGPRIIQIAHHPTGLKTVSLRPQQIRLAGISGPGGRIPVHIIGSTATAPPAPVPPAAPAENVREPVIQTASTQNTSLPQTSTTPRRIILATTADLNRWPDPTKVIQFATSDLTRIPGLAGLRPGLIGLTPTLTPSSGPMSGIRTSTSSMSTVRPLASATIPLVRPPSVPLGCTGLQPTNVSSVGQSVITSSASPGSSRMPFITSMSSLVATNSGSVGVGTVMHPQTGQTFAVSAAPAPSTTVAQQVPEPTPSTSNTSPNPVKRNCRCGNATPTPGKLTCIGQRCACYADKNACSDCKCKGCKNPYVPGTGGHKLLHGVRAIIDTQTNQIYPIPPNNGQPSPVSGVMSGNPGPPVSVSVAAPMVNQGGGPNPTPTFATIQTGMPSAMPHHMSPLQFIPVRFGPNGPAQYIQIANPQALQQMPIFLSASSHHMGHMQGNPGPGITIQGIPVSGLHPGTPQQIPIHHHHHHTIVTQVNPNKVDGRPHQE